MENFALTTRERLARIRAELRIGLPINCGDGAFVPVEFLSEARFDALRSLKGVQILLASRRARDLGLPNSAEGDNAFYLPDGCEYREILALADPAIDTPPATLMGLGIGNLPDGKTSRILDLLRRTRILPAALYVPTRIDNATEITDEDWRALEDRTITLEPVSNAQVPLELAGHTRLNIYRNLDDDLEHYAVIVGEPDPNLPLVRLHSACFTGDSLGSMKCDCGPQLHEALREMKTQGGILLYLSQEGRGIGLANKIRAYSLQDRGSDTVEANNKLGFDDDQRDFRIGARILEMMNISRIKLLTNNPRKVAWFEQSGIEVAERLPLIIPPREENAQYLATKRDKSGHLL